MRPDATSYRPGPPTQTLTQWCNGIRVLQIAHLRAAAHYHRLNRMLGIPVTVLTALVTTSLFTNIDDAAPRTLLLVAGLISAVSAALSAVQTFLNYPEQAVRHGLAGARYGRLRRKVDEVLAIGPGERTLDETLAGIRQEWDQIEAEAPTVAQDFVDHAVSLVRRPQEATAPA